MPSPAVLPASAAKVFNNIEHFFAKFLTVAARIGTVVKASEPAVEAVTAQIPVYGAAALPVEKLVYALAGEAFSVLALLGGAGAQKLLDAGFEGKIVDALKALVADSGQIVAMGKDVFQPKA